MCSDNSERIREAGDTCLGHSISPLDVEGWFNIFFLFFISLICSVADFLYKSRLY